MSAWKHVHRRELKGHVIEISKMVNGLLIKVGLIGGELNESRAVHGEHSKALLEKAQRLGEERVAERAHDWS